MPVYTGVFYRQEGVPESSGSEPCAASTRPLIVLSAQSHERNGPFFVSHRQDYPDLRYYLSFTQVTFFCFGCSSSNYVSPSLGVVTSFMC